MQAINICARIAFGFLFNITSLAWQTLLRDKRKRCSSESESAKYQQRWEIHIVGKCRSKSIRWPNTTFDKVIC